VSETERIPGERFLLAPGPTHIPGEVLNAMHRQPMDHGDPRLEQLIASCDAGLRRVLHTKKAEIYTFASNGHGAWEAAIENLLAPQQAVLIPMAGHFSEQWAIQVEATGRRVIRTKLREGYPIDPNDVEQALREDSKHEIAAVFVVHTDTARGCTCDLQAIRKAIDAARHPALYVVDVISSLAAAPFEMDALGVNVAIGGSQKGLMCPPGIGFVGVDERAEAIAANNPAPRYYWDWGRRKAKYNYTQFCGSAPQNLLFALEAALALLFREGLEAVQARHTLLARAVHAAVEAWSSAGTMSLHWRVPAARSVSVTTIDVAPGIEIDAVRAVARERFQVSFAPALGVQRGKAFRIGHLGDLNAPMILGCLAAIEAAMTVCRVPYGREGMHRAIEVLAEPER